MTIRNRANGAAGRKEMQGIGAVREALLQTRISYRRDDMPPAARRRSRTVG
jgi:hypothetical protein